MSYNTYIICYISKMAYYKDIINGFYSNFLKWTVSKSMYKYK